MEHSKTKKIDFIVSPEIRNEFIRLSESKNVCISDFIEEFIKQYFRNEDFSRLFGYFAVNARSFPDYDENFYNINKALTNEEMREIFQNKKPKVNYIYFEAKIETIEKVSDFCFKNGINRCYFLYFILSEKPFYLKRAEKDVVFKSKINKNDDDLDDDDLDECDLDECDLDECDLNKSNKRGRPSNKEVFYKYTDDKRIVNSFSDLKLNDIIYIVSNEFDNSPKEKYKTIKTSSDCILLPTLKKIKIHSFEVRGKFVMINRKSFNSNQFELELTINEYYNTLQVSRNGCVYSCLKSMYEEAKNKMVEYEIKSRLEKINNLNIEIELIKNL